MMGDSPLGFDVNIGRLLSGELERARFKAEQQAVHQYDRKRQAGWEVETHGRLASSSSQRKSTESDQETLRR